MPHSLGSPAPLYAREGRDLQKYGAGGERLVAGCIPVRFKPGIEGPAGVEVLLITSRGGKGHVFPKGGWEVDEDLETAALRETVEEAGVRGLLELPMLGTFPFHSHKAERLHTAHQGRCIAHMFALHTREELPQWPEAGQRTRAWCSLQEACHALRHEWMREALFCWIRRCGWEHLLCQQQPKENGPMAVALVPSLTQPQNGHAAAPLPLDVPQQPPQEAAQQPCMLGLPESAELPSIERVAVKS